MTSYVILDEAGQAQAGRHSADLVDQLVTRGVLSTPAWRSAFGQVPRHVFAPQFRLPDNLGGQTLDAAQPAQQDDWLRAVYSNDALIIDVADNGTLNRTCSSPAVVATMLEALQASQGQSVLEIGTGTGWNAGLLAARLGSGAVTSIDIDPMFVEQARERLAVLDLHPTLVVTDGYRGYHPRAPYDRIVATCSVRRFPPEWLRQVQHGGMILADIRGSFAGGLARITRTTADVASGQFLSARVSFMPLRSPDNHILDNSELASLIGPVAGAVGEARSTNLHPNVLTEQNDFGFFAQLAIPGSLTTPVVVESVGNFFCLIHPDTASWARVELSDGASLPVVQNGRRRLWDELEAAYEQWSGLDRPTRDQFMITVTSDAGQYVSLPDTPHRWRLPL